MKVSLDHSRRRPDDAEMIGLKLGESLLAKGADKILAEVYGQH